MKILRINPLLGKELRIRMRNWRTFGMVSLYLLVLGLFTFLFFLSNFYLINSGYASLAEVGRNLFIFLSVIQFILVVFLVPALVGNAISGERERQTLDLLTCTQLTSLRIVSGKLAAALSTVVLLILAGLPLYGFIFLLGGVSPLEVLKLFVIVLVMALFVGCWTLMLSSLFRRTVAAIVASYALVLFLMGGSFILFSLLVSIFINAASVQPIALIMTTNPLSLLGWLYPDFVEELFQAMVQGWNLGGIKIWQLSFLVQGSMAALSLLSAARAVDPLKRTRRR